MLVFEFSYAVLELKKSTWMFQYYYEAPTLCPLAFPAMTDTFFTSSFRVSKCLWIVQRHRNGQQSLSTGEWCGNKIVN